MRSPIEINFNEEQPVINAGVIGEHNVQPLKITPPTYLLDADYFRAAFEVNNSTIYSDRIGEETESAERFPIALTLWQQLTSVSQIACAIEGYKNDGTYIGKSKSIYLSFDTSTEGTADDVDSEPYGMAVEVAKNTEARHSHSNKSDLDKVSGVNTGDQDLSGLEPKLPAAPIDPERKVLNGNKQWVGKQSAYIVDDLAALNALTGMAAGDQAIVKHVSRKSNLSASLLNGGGNPNSIYGRVVPKLNVDPIITKPENVSELIDAYVSIRQQLLGSSIFVNSSFALVITPDLAEGIIVLMFIDDKDDNHMIFYALDDVLEEGTVIFPKYTWLETLDGFENVDLCSAPKFDYSCVLEAQFFNPDQNLNWPATTALWEFLKSIMSPKSFTNVPYFYDGTAWRDFNV